LPYVYRLDGDELEVKECENGPKLGCLGPPPLPLRQDDGKELLVVLAIADDADE
jgi:hypothetical protein